VVDKTLELFEWHVEHAKTIIKEKLYSFDDEGKLNVQSDVYLNDRKLPNDRLPIRFGKITGTFWARWCGLRRLDGLPYEVGASCVLAGNYMTNLVGAPKKVPGRLDLEYATSLQSLEGFPNEVGHCIFTWREDLPLLRLLTAKKLQLDLNQANKPEAHPARHCLEILNKYAGQGRAGAIDCKRELVAAGFEGNAKW